MGTVRENHYTFLIISHSVLLGMRNVSDRSFEENQNIYFMFNNFFFKNRAIYEMIWKILYSWAGLTHMKYGACTLHAG